MSNSPPHFLHYKHISIGIDLGVFQTYLRRAVADMLTAGLLAAFLT
jgi:hypothetical protein